MNSTAVPPAETPGERIVLRAMLVLGLASILGGFLSHRLLVWALGLNLIGFAAIWRLQFVLARRRGRMGDWMDRSADALRSLAIVLPLLLGVIFAVMALLPHWFPDSCPLPPRHH